MRTRGRKIIESMRQLAVLLLSVHVFYAFGQTPLSATIITLRCQECRRADTLSNCTNIVICDRTEECFMDQVITDQLNVVYVGGCRSKDVCSRIGKKRRDLIACSRCCSDTDACNKRLCGIQNAVTQTIKNPITNPIRCRVCNRATTLSGCNETLTCDRSLEECYIDELITEQLTIVYEGGCRAKDVCNRAGKKRGELVACSRCCSDVDECNKRLCGIQNALALTTQVPITSPIRCRVCNRATTLSDCNQTLTCDKTLEDCYMDELVTDKLTIVYEAGCRAKTVCSRVGKKRSDLYACSRCCDVEDDCNTRLCNINKTLALTTQMPITSPIRCRVCNRATTLSDCNQTLTCDKTLEECYMDKLITDQLTVLYEGGCRAKDVCHKSGKKRSDLVACSRCCNFEDDCNTGLCFNNQTNQQSNTSYRSASSLDKIAGSDLVPIYHTHTLRKNIPIKILYTNALVQTTQTPKTSKIRCRFCNRASTLSDCNKVEICASTHEECYMDELITDQLTVVYEGGCRATDVCSGNGRKRDDLVACSRCCSGQDDCNKRLCGIKDDSGGNGLPITYIQVPVGYDLSLNCSDHDSLQQNVSWTKLNACGGKTETAQGSLYYQQDATEGDSGLYTCTYSGKYGRTFAKYFHVNITSTKQRNICNFDSDSLCGWQQEKNDSLDWILQSGATLSSGTGPNNDHTLRTANGKYLCIEASSPSVFGDFAILASPVQPANQTKCFEFGFYMNGDGTGGLYVLLQDSCLRNEKQIFRQVGENGARWNKASVTIPDQSVPHDYRIIIKADVGATFHGDTSIDDLAIQNGLCQGDHGVAIVG